MNRVTAVRPPVSDNIVIEMSFDRVRKREKDRDRGGGKDRERGRERKRRRNTERKGRDEEKGKIYILTIPDIESIRQSNKCYFACSLLGNILREQMINALGKCNSPSIYI